MQSIFWVCLAILFMDRLSKAIALHSLTYGQSVPVVPNIFHFTLVYNKGAAFGILQNSAFLFVIISLVSIFCILFLVLFKPAKIKSVWMKLALALILSGAIGNLVDRIRFSYVIDFLDFRIWPVFNIADSAITVGAALLGYSIIIQKNN